MKLCCGDNTRLKEARLGGEGVHTVNIGKMCIRYKTWLQVFCYLFLGWIFGTEPCFVCWNVSALHVSEPWVVFERNRVPRLACVGTQQNSPLIFAVSTMKNVNSRCQCIRVSWDDGYFGCLWSLTGCLPTWKTGKAVDILEFSKNGQVKCRTVSPQAVLEQKCRLVCHGHGQHLCASTMCNF